MTSLLPLPHPRAELSLTSWQGNHRSIIRVMVSLSPSLADFNAEPDTAKIASCLRSPSKVATGSM